MKVTAQYAVEHFDDLARAVDGGEVVEIARPEKPALRLVASSLPVLRRVSERVLGAGRAISMLPRQDWMRLIRSGSEPSTGDRFCLSIDGKAAA